MVFECPRCHERFDSSALDGLDARFPCCKYQIRVANLIPLFQALCRCVDEQAHALKQIDPGSILEELPPVDKRPFCVCGRLLVNLVSGPFGRSYCGACGRLVESRLHRRLPQVFTKKAKS
jgi:hypothetical protein